MKKNGELKETDLIKYGIQDTVEVKLPAKAKDQRVIHQMLRRMTGCQKIEIY